MDQELTGPIVRKDPARQIAYAAVLVPGEADTDGDALTAEKIEEVAHGWLENYGNIDLQHNLVQQDARPVESYVSANEMPVTLADGTERTLPAGSWVLATKVQDAEVWKGIESGRYTGYSVMGVRAKALKDAAATKSAPALKRTTLSDLGPDWVAPFVSIVEEPAVPAAKFFTLKAADAARKDAVDDAQTAAQSLADLLGGERGQVLSQLVNDLEEADGPSAAASLIDEALDQVEIGDDEGEAFQVLNPLVGARNQLRDEAGQQSTSSKSKTTRVLELLGLREPEPEPAEKESRSISDSNLDRLVQAESAIQELLEVARAERERREQDDDTVARQGVNEREGRTRPSRDEAATKEVEVETPEEIASVVEEAVEKQVSPLRERLDELESARQAEKEAAEAAKEEEEGQPGEEPAASEKRVEELEQQVESEREARAEKERELDEFMQEIDKRLPAASRKSVVGQDTDEPAPERDQSRHERDALGRRVRR